MKPTSPTIARSVHRLRQLSTHLSANPRNMSSQAQDTARAGGAQGTAEHASSNQHNSMMDGEAAVKRNPHPDFKKVEASRPDWHERQPNWEFTKTKNPDWKLGGGANDGGEGVKKEHREIDPYAEGRPAVFNYKLLISAIIPRPIGFVATRSKDGTSSQVCVAE